MKKILASLVLAGLTAFAFAQTAPDTTTAPAPTVKFSGTFDFGGQLTDAYGAGSSQAYLKSFDPYNGTSGRLNFNIKYDAGVFGWYIRLREQDAWTDGNSGFPELRRAYGWTDVANGAVRISFGRLNTSSWAIHGNNDSWEGIGGTDGFVGSTVEFKLVDGLNFGAYIPFTNTNDVASNLFLESQIAAAYRVAGLGEVEAGVVPGAADANGVYGNDGQFFINVGYSAVQGLTAYAQVLSAYLGDQVYGFTYLSENLGYNNFGPDLPLNVQLKADQQISANTASKYSSSSPTGTGLYFNPQVDYTVAGVYDVGLAAVVLYETENLGNATGTSTATNVKYDGGQIQNYGFELDPFVKVAVAKNVSVQWYVGFTSGADTLGANDPFIGGTSPGVRDPKSSSTVYQSKGGVAVAAAPFSQSSSLNIQQTGAGSLSLFGVLPNYEVKSGVSVDINY